MNERDYNLIEYCSIVAGLSLTSEWLMFMSLFSLPYTVVSLIFFVLIGIATLFIATVAHFKKILYVQEMKEYLKEGGKEHNGEVVSNTASKLQ